MRKVSKKKYLLAFILTIVVFVGGILIGILMEGARVNYSEESILDEKVSLRSLQLQQQYIESGLADCEALNHVLEVNIDELGKKMAEMLDFEKDAVFSQEEFTLLKQDYFLTQIQFLLLSEEIDQKCHPENVKIVYFYNENEFDTQGQILDYLKKVFGGRVLIFSFDSNFNQEPMISVLIKSYGIEEYPSVIVEDTVFQGHTETEVLMQEICQEFLKMDNKMPDECLG